MKITVLEEDKNKIEFEIAGEDHTLCNALRKQLWTLPEVDVAVYRIEHPAVSNPVMLVQTNKGSPRKAIEKAIQGLKHATQSFVDQYKKVF